jgi:hypothetical protein
MSMFLLSHAWEPPVGPVRAVPIEEVRQPTFAIVQKIV